jgi:hypothetical protein
VIGDGRFFFGGLGSFFWRLFGGLRFFFLRVGERKREEQSGRAENVHPEVYVHAKNAPWSRAVFGKRRRILVREEE